MACVCCCCGFRDKGSAYADIVHLHSRIVDGHLVFLRLFFAFEGCMNIYCFVEITVRIDVCFV